MLSDTRHKRKSSLENNHLPITTTHQSISSSSLAKRFRGGTTTSEGKINSHELQLSSKDSVERETKPMTLSNGEAKISSKNFDPSKLTPAMLAEYRRLQQELQCQEALLVLMQKLKTNQKLISQANNNGVKQRTTTPTTATKLSQQPTVTDGKVPLTATKQPLVNEFLFQQAQTLSSQNNSNRPNPTKPPHPNQYTVNRSNLHSQQQSASKTSLPLSQATRQPNNNTLPAATRVSSTIPATATKNSSSSKTNGVAAEQHLLNAKLALRKQLEQTLLQIPTPKPTTCDLTFIPGVNGWSEFLAYLGLEQASNIYMDIVQRRAGDENSFVLPNVCAQCGTDWSVTWHEVSSPTTDNSLEEKIFCDRCTKTSQKKLLKQDHSNRLRQAFIKALQQEKELDAKFQQQSSTTTTTTPTPSVKQSSSSLPSQPASKHSHQSTKHSSKPLSTKASSNHHHHHHHNNNSNPNNHHRHHSTKSSSSKSQHLNSPAIPNLTPSPAETLASTLAALQNSEQMELFQKHFLSNLLPFGVPNQAAAALAAKTSQQQQAAALAALPAMAASLMRQSNPAQYLLDMIPQAAKQQHQHHHHSK